MYALTPEGTIYVRYGISHTDPAGDYWKEVPGKFVAFAGKNGLLQYLDMYMLQSKILCGTPFIRGVLAAGIVLSQNIVDLFKKVWGGAICRFRCTTWHP